MRQDPRHGISAALSAQPAIGSGAGGGEATVTVGPLGVAGSWLGRRRIELSHPLFGAVALTTLLGGCLAIAAVATAGPSLLVPRSYFAFPGWYVGPLHGVFGSLSAARHTLSWGFSGLVLAMALAYGIALAAVRTLAMRTIVVVVVALHMVMLLSPPLQLTDIFNYLGYARLGALHGLNPYAHVIETERHDPVFWLSTWHHLKSPYGPVFTLLTYPLGLLPLPVAYWLLKLGTVLAGLGFVALVARCARQLGRDPRFAVLFVAANPVYLVYELGGFHNDVFMLLPAVAAISFLLAGRDRMSGAALVLAVAVKFTAGLLLPFMLLAARPARRRVRLLTGIAVAAVPTVLVTYEVFGTAGPNLSDQTSLLTSFSIPNLLGVLLGQGGGTHTLLQLASLAVMLLAVVLLWRAGDWLTGAGWTTLAFLCSLSWLVPWYAAWLLPLAALGSSARLRRAAAAFSVFLLLSFLPANGLLMAKLRLSTMRGPASLASLALQHRLAR